MRRHRKYVVGYDNDWNPVYGKPSLGSDTAEGPSCVDPFTLREAQRYLRKMVSRNPVIYKLVPLTARELRGKR